MLTRKLSENRPKESGKSEEKEKNQNTIPSSKPHCFGRAFPSVKCLAAIVSATKLQRESLLHRFSF